MDDQRQRRSFNDEFKHQIVPLYIAGKSRSEYYREYNLVPIVVERWIKLFNATGSDKGCVNRTPKEQAQTKLCRRIGGKKWIMITKHAALIVTNKYKRSGANKKEGLTNLNHVQIKHRPL